MLSAKNWAISTACPTNAGTGMRASVLIHLPALVLTKQIEKVLKGSRRWDSTSVRGFYGEGSQVMGNFFQISNQTTLGQSERDTVESLERVTRQIIDYEQRARDDGEATAASRSRTRSGGPTALCAQPRDLRPKEVINLSSAVRFGVALRMPRAARCDVEREELDPHPAGPPAALPGHRAGAAPSGTSFAPTTSAALLEAADGDDAGASNAATGKTGGSHPCTTSSPNACARSCTWRARKRPGSSTTTSAPSTCSSASSARARGSPPRCSTTWAWTSTQIRQAVENMVAASGGTLTIGEIPFTPRAKRVLELAIEEARQLGPQLRRHRAPAARADPRGRGRRRQVLLELGVDRKRVREETLKLLGGTAVETPKSEEESETPALDQFGRDLTAAGPREQARPGHRPRERDRARHPGPLAAARRTTRC